MPSFLDSFNNSGHPASDTRRNTTDHNARSLSTANTPSMSRSSSVASNRSEPSTPSWYSTYNGADTSKIRKDSTASRASISPRNSVKLEQKPGTSGTSGWKALFSQNSEEKKEKKKKKQKEVEKIVLTSRHAAAVKTRLAVDPTFQEQRRRSSASSDHIKQAPPPPVSGPHLTAEQQEFRFPHSGPPSIHHTAKGHFHRKGRSGEEVEADMPELTRIVSGDDRDDEDDRAQRDREAWVMKRNDAAMRRFTLVEGPDGEDEEGRASRNASLAKSVGEAVGEDEKLGGKVLNVDGTSVIGVELEGDAYTPKAKSRSHGGLGHGWHRNETGKWTR